MNRKITLAAAVLGIALGAALWQLHPLDNFANDTKPTGGNTPNTAGLQALATGTVANFIVTPDAAPLSKRPFIDADGTEHHLADFTGKVILVNLWATWCAPCRHEMPSLDRLDSAMAGPDFDVVPISLDRAGLAVGEKFFQDLNIQHLTLYLDKSGRMGRDMGALGLPLTVLIGRDGREIGRVVGPAEWDAPEAQALIRAAIDLK